MDPEVMGTH